MFLTIAVSGLAALTADVAGAGLFRQRARTAADFALLSALRVRRDNLEAIAARWDAFGGGLTNGPAGLESTPALWPGVATAADALRRAISGFQGRVTSALTVALDANGLPHAAARSVSGTGTRLGVTARTETVLVAGAPMSLPGAWYARGWSAGDPAPPLTDGAALAVSWPLSWRGSDATLEATADGALVWDADPTDAAVAASGRGGFARTFTEAIDGAAFTPHRFPFFRAVRTPEAG
jgi:hypothetical protein